MQIPILNAISYQKSMVSGRTQPGLFFCEDDNGNDYGEYVVKLKAGMESRENGLMAELISADMAK